MPNIDDVCLVFFQFQQKMTRTLTRLSRFSIEQSEAADKAKRELRDELEKMGLASHIDWSEEAMTPKRLRYALVQKMRGEWIVRLKGSLTEMGKELKKRGNYNTGWTVVNTTRRIGDFLYGR